MPRFSYEVKRGPGQPTSGVLEAESQRAAVARLRDMGYFPITVQEQAESASRDVIRHALRRVRLKDRNILFRQLANLMESGMPLTRSLATISEQTQNPKVVQVVERLREDVQKGSSFAEALERHPKVFSAMSVNMIRAGEDGGMLEEVLWRIVTFGEQEEELRGKTVAAMVYPAFLMFMGSVAVFILVSFVFPKFIQVFDELGTELPLITRVVVGFCGFMGNFWWAVLLALGALGAALVSYVRSEVGRGQFDRVVLRVPLLGQVIQKYEMAKFARTLGTLLDNGVPVLHSLRVTADTLSNSAIAGEIDGVHGSVAEGGAMSEGLQESPYFPPLVVNMMAVGEESGRLGAVMKRIAEAYDMEVDRAVKTMMAMLEPLLIVVMGVIVGTLVIAMLLPMLTLSAAIG
jgi:type IV pilus assembly protein PilC